LTPKSAPLQMQDTAATPIWGPHTAAIAILLILLVVVAFSPCLDNGFVHWDDDQNFNDNPHFRGLGWAQIRWAWTTFLMGVYQPLAWMILGAQYVLWGLQPRGYHLTSLALYALNTVVLFVLTTTLPRRCLPESDRAGRGAGPDIIGGHESHRDTTAR
jgi:hypothetical protein